MPPPAARPGPASGPEPWAEALSKILAEPGAKAALLFAAGLLALLLFRRLILGPRPGRRRSPAAPAPVRTPAQTQGPSRLPCRWRRAGFRHGVRAQRWICRACGVDAFSRDGSPPKECKRALRGGL
jgi:hypothetical protein